MPIISPNPLPDFRNLGVQLRVLVCANLMLLAAALAGGTPFQARLLQLALWVEPVLLLSVVALSALSPHLARLRYPRLVLHGLFVVALGLAVQPGWLTAGHAVAAWCAALAILHYLDLRAAALAPALTEARLTALQSRIRPHFLFNCLNAAIGLIASDPAKAEIVLQNLADLFRRQLADNRRLSSLQQELELARRYLEIEAIRLGERLQVRWKLDGMPADAALPALLLQPLLENAVYHGVEPLLHPAPVTIRIYALREQLHIDIRNPLQPAALPRHGNGMAIANVRERLMLHFDHEAGLNAVQREGHYQVHIHLPLQPSPVS